MLSGLTLFINPSVDNNISIILSGSFEKTIKSLIPSEPHLFMYLVLISSGNMKNS